MEISDYRMPQAKVVEVAPQGMLCESKDNRNSNGHIDPYERETFDLD